MMSTLFKAGSTTSFPMVSHSPFPKIPVIPLPQRNSPSSFPLPLYPQHIHWEISWGFMGNIMKKKGPDLEIVKKKPFSVLFLGKMMNNAIGFQGTSPFLVLLSMVRYFGGIPPNTSQVSSNFPHGRGRGSWFCTAGCLVVAKGCKNKG